MVELGALHVGKTTHVQIYRNQIARASARGAQVTLLVKFVPKIFFQKMVRNDVLSDGKDL